MSLARPRGLFSHRRRPAGPMISRGSTTSRTGRHMAGTGLADRRIGEWSMSVHARNTERLIEAAIHQLTPEMEHVCLLPSSTFVKITRIVHVVRSEIQVRADEGPRCPAGSKDLHPGEADAGCEPAPVAVAGGRKRAKATAPGGAVGRGRAAPRRSRRGRRPCDE